MKNIFVSFLVFALILMSSSCSLDDDHQSNFHFEALEVVSADFPETFEYGNIYRINVTFNRPTTCHYFEGFDFNRTGETERTIYGVASVLEDEKCEDLTDSEVENYFDFEVIYTGTYTFKIWAGVNENDEDEFLIIEVPVEN
ncbi:hypothetical protein [Abyssalbus ytuae]|uniref:Uncharacterized protein n=1 Tax=Abyssalbus ytuae TaxID=2926907 RepID=A0A9E7D1S9_9FLAO|nr:hypothetical protein [Abyssalbus ytuae]UOB15954.1 hypothetical protein MQE35_09395 [Abyssalbus ytuae]